jgi:hypothetical protein
VTADNAIAATPAGSECGSGNWRQRAAAIKRHRQANEHIAIVSERIDNVSPRRA